jgi:hypothetical protein
MMSPKKTPAKSTTMHLTKAFATIALSTALVFRGDRREPIFQDDADRRRFVQMLAEA